MKSEVIQGKVVNYARTMPQNYLCEAYSYHIILGKFEVRARTVKVLDNVRCFSSLLPRLGVFSQRRSQLLNTYPLSSVVRKDYYILAGDRGVAAHILAVLAAHILAVQAAHILTVHNLAVDVVHRLVLDVVHKLAAHSLPIGFLAAMQRT